MVRSGTTASWITEHPFLSLHVLLGGSLFCWIQVRKKLCELFEIRSCVVQAGPEPLIFLILPSVLVLVHAATPSTVFVISKNVS